MCFNKTIHLLCFDRGIAVNIHNLILENLNPLLCYKSAPNFFKGIPQWHFRMLNDKQRLKFYADEIKEKVGGKVVLDLGAGTGILSYLALMNGAKKVIAVESNSSLVALMRHFLKDFISDQRLVILHKDIFHLEKGDFPATFDILIHELFGPEGLSEKVAEMIEGLRKKDILSPGVEIFPFVFEINFREVTRFGVEEIYEFEDFAGFPLSKLSEISKLFPKLYSFEYIAKKAVQFSDEVFFSKEIILNGEPISFDERHSLKLGASTTHLAQSIKIHGSKNHLNSDFYLGSSHWPNAFLQVDPKRCSGNLCLKNELGRFSFAYL